MNDDWRLEVVFRRQSHASEFKVHLIAGRLRSDFVRRFRERVIVTVDGHKVFFYAGSREQAERVRAAIEDEVRLRDWVVDIDFRHWHPITECWEDPELPLPSDEAARRSEREMLMIREREETANRGYPEFEVRAALHSHHDAMALVGLLRDEGLPVVHRWRYLLVGATDEDSAKELADHIRDEAPTGALVKVEGTWAAVLAERRPSGFAVLGA